MNRDDLLDFVVVQLHEQEIDILNRKGAEYNQIDNVFANFERTAAQQNLTREQVLLVYLSKHHDSILKMVDAIVRKDARYFVTLSEPWPGRFHDVRNYYGILASMTHDFLERNKPPVHTNTINEKEGLYD